MDNSIILFAGILFIIILVFSHLFTNARKKAIAAGQEIIELQNEIYLQKNSVSEALRMKEETAAFYHKMEKELSEKHKTELQQMLTNMEATELKYAPLINDAKELGRRKDELKAVQADIDTLKEIYQDAYSTYSQLEKQINLYKETLDLNEYGVYEPAYSFEVPEQYQVELQGIYAKQKLMVQKGEAAVCTTEWTVGGSVAEGRRMTKQFIKLMLYAFNGESDALIAKVKWNNVNRTKERIQKAFDDINKLGISQHVHITEAYLALKLAELALSYEYEQKKYEEKEEQRRIREQMREEERAQKEFERARKEAEDEETRYARAIEKAQKELSTASASEVELLNEKIRSLEQNLKEAHERKERAISLAQLTKVGHIYVISNIGSFGEDVYKIGMTRRLDPLDRVKELGDASVPFQFDVHAVIYSENAPQLEYELHKNFHGRRLNRINGKKEFFKVYLDEIESFIKEQTNADIQFTKLAEAKEYRETMKLLERANVVGIKEESSEKEVFPKVL
ncbi:MAG TPA: DUF4041 domain-containing protein [Flavisolibacter sp.]|nr:DUF4041 domain-containing protein [Flavisolibacter sp.]